ncbi:MAG TPA: hypothetical protein ENI98_01355 [Gammaproteobacteria bacterium]|nr:hypothetical protein [Gammaproteobacteria bacterium]
MFVKLGGNIWLVLTAVVVFPAMLYLTRTVPDDTIENPEHASVNRSETLQASSWKNKSPVSSSDIRHAGNMADTREVSDSYSDSDERSDMVTDQPDRPRREQSYRREDQARSIPERLIGKSDNSPVESRSGKMAAVNYYTVGGSANVVRETATTALESPPASVTAGTEKKSASSSATSQSSVDNSILSPLYTAEIQKPQKIKPKCPPVYMGINAYARNMRIAMGCNDN